MFYNYIDQHFNFFIDNCKHPPIPDGANEVGGALQWCAIIRTHVTDIMSFFKKVYIISKEDDSIALANNMEFDVMEPPEVFQPPTGYTTIL
jgi:hypothetical protein